MSAPLFIHLNLHTEYSLADSLITLDSLMAKLRELHMPAVALTDLNNIFAAVKFYQAARNAGIKPILGAEIFYRSDAETKITGRLTVLCANNEGYANLLKIISYAYEVGQCEGMPCLPLSILTAHAEGLIVILGSQSECLQWVFKQDLEKAQVQLNQLHSAFQTRLYLEIQRIGKADEEKHNQLLLAFASRYQIPVIASNAVRFLESEDYEAHEARVCIAQGSVLADESRRREYTAAQYLRSSEEMQTLFADLPAVLENTINLAKRCNVTLTLGKNVLPNFPVPAGTTAETYLTRLAEQSLTSRLALLKIKRYDEATYFERLHVELKVINSMGFASYFLIVADFIAWAKSANIPVGPGRGSGAGSLVAFAIGITDLDPLQYDLLFERFLNPERISMPDFDIDFCMDRRDEVIDYVADKYGRRAVSQIITFGTMAAKAVVRDVGRVLSLPYGFVDKIAKLIPLELGITLEKALTEPQLKEKYESEEETRTLIDLALKLEGLTRNAGKHAGGVVIAPKQLSDFTALYCEADGSNLVSQFDKDDVEAVGLVKFDFLGLRTLTIIHWAMETINALSPEKFDINLIPVDDAATYRLLKDCHTSAVFQLESRGMRDLVKRLQPDCFEDVIALVALFRPGPLQSGMVDDFINRKHGRAEVDYLHPKLTDILRPTYGVIVYQEQVMQIAQVLAGYTLGGADLLRRAMGKKKPEEMAKQRQIFIDGAITLGVEAQLAGHIFDLMEKFAGYGFNKSHSAAYALLAYQTAYLKTHYPAAFMAAVLSSDMDNTDKVVLMINECERMQLKVLPPDINLSAYRFSLNEAGAIVFGLGAIKGVGEAAIESIIAERVAGPYQSLFDLCKRVDVRKVNRRVLEALIKSGALDSFKMHRAALCESVDLALQYAEQQQKSQSEDLFALFDPDNQQTPAYVDTRPWRPETQLQNEKLTLGFYISGHPLDQYVEEIKALANCRIVELAGEQTRTVTIAGMVSAMRSMPTKKGDRMAFVTLDDKTGQLEFAVFPELYAAHREWLLKDALVIAQIEISIDKWRGGVKISAKTLEALLSVRSQRAQALMLTVDQNPGVEFVKQLQKKLATSAGQCPVKLNYISQSASILVQLGEAWQVNLTDALLYDLQEWLGSNKVRIIYKD